MTYFLSNAGTAQPLLIVLEDLHDSDKGTLDLLIHMARTIDKSRLLIVGTYRDVEVDRTHPLSSTLAELRKSSPYERVTLRGLTIDEVQRMLSGLSGQETPWGLAEAVFKQTEGNPLFVQEVLRYVIEDGLLVRESGEWKAVSADSLIGSIPEGLRDVIGKRLSSLSPGCNQILSIASVMGREFRFESLKAVANIDDEELYAAIEEARKVSVIEERSAIGTGVTYRFTHAFFRQTLYEEMIAPKRNQLHQQIAAALEEIFQNRLEEHAVELAEHFSHSTSPDDLKKAVNYGEMASERASSVFDYGEGVRLLEQTLQVQEVLDPADEVKRCDLLITLGEALISAGFPRRFLDKQAIEAFSIAESRNDRKRASRISILSLSAISAFGTGPALSGPEAAEWAERADRFTEEGTVERARVGTILGAIYFMSVNPKKGVQFLQRSLDLSRQLGDNETFWFCATNWLVFVSAPFRASARLRLADELSEQSGQGISPTVLIRSLEFVADTYLAMGRRGRVEEVTKEMSSLIDRVGRRTASSYTHQTLESMTLFLDGRLEEAVEHLMKIGALVEEFEIGGTFKVGENLYGLRPMLYLGSAEELLIRDLTLQGPIVEAFYQALLGRTEETRIILDRYHQALSRIRPDQDEAWWWRDIILLEAATIIKHRETIERVLIRFAGSRVLTTGIFYTTIISRHLGAGAAVLGRSTEARSHYLDAIKVAGHAFPPGAGLVPL